MRSAQVMIGGQAIVVQEQKIKYIKDELMPKIEPAWQTIINGNVAQLVENLGTQMVSLFPELAGIDLDECYPSELEAFIEAWVNVNFTGLKRIAGPLLSLLKTGQPTPGPA